MKELILKVYICKHCKRKFVIVKAKHTLIPVDYEEDIEYPEDTIYDRNKMQTHLIYCPGRRNDWQKVKEYYLRNPSMLVIKKNQEKNTVDKPAKVQKELTKAERAEHNKRFEQIVAEEKRLKGISDGT